jgi:hypothetical protein
MLEILTLKRLKHNQTVKVDMDEGKLSSLSIPMTFIPTTIVNAVMILVIPPRGLYYDIMQYNLFLCSNQVYYID